MPVIFMLFCTRARADLAPAWTWQSTQAIEWCVPLGEPKDCAVAIGLADGSVQVINLITAAPRLDEILKGKPGTRFAGESGNTAYFLDRYTVFAVSVTDTFDRDRPLDQARWKVGSAADVNNRESGDPEFIERLTDAVATPAGVAVLNSSGRIAELNRSDGSIRWSDSLGSGANGSLHVMGSSLVAIVKAKSGFDACFFDLKSSNPTPRRHALGGSEPMWQEFVRDGVIAAWPGKLTLTRAEEGTDRLALKTKFPLKAALIGVFRPTGEGKATKTECLVAVDAGGRIAAHDVSTGAAIWSTSLRDLGKFRPTRMTMTAEMSIVVDDDGRFAAIRAVDGGLGAAWTSSGAEQTLGVTASARFVHALRVVQDTETGRRTKRLQLVRTPIVRQEEWSKSDAEANQSAEWLDFPTTAVRGCVWSPGRVLVFSDRLLHMYVLPEE